MAMPAVKSVWPPEPFAKAFADIEEWAVWWEGTSTKLTNFYMSRGTGYNGMPMGLRQRTYAAAEVFFNRQDGQAVAGPTELRLHLPIPGAIARKVASIMFSTPPRFCVATGTEEDIAADEVVDAQQITEDPVQGRVDKLLNSDTMHTFLLEAGQSWSALGGHYLRVVWDEAVIPDRAFLDKVDHDHAIPEWKWGVLTSVAFWSEIGKTKEGKVLRHFEDYQPGYIEHAVYEGSGDDVGMRVPLNEVEGYDFSGIIESMDSTGMVPTGYEKIAAVYIPRRKTNPTWRTDPQLKYMGYSDFSKDVIPLFASIDETWTSLMRDVRQGKGRLIVAENLLELLGPGRGNGFDLNREIFSPVAEAIDGEGKPIIEQVQFNIRVTEHLETIRGLFLEVLHRVGISPLTMGLSDQVATTATEIKALTADTLATQDEGQRYWGPALSDICTALIAIDAEKFADGVTLEEPVEVEWPAAVEISDEERAKTVALWGEAASTHTKIAYLHPDWDEPKIQAEVDEIGEEKLAAMPPLLADPFGGGESDPNADPNKDPKAGPPMKKAPPPFGGK